MYIIANLFMLCSSSFTKHFFFAFALCILQVHVCDIVFMQIFWLYGAHRTLCYDSLVQLLLNLQRLGENRILQTKGSLNGNCCKAKPRVEMQFMSSFFLWQNQDYFLLYTNFNFFLFFRDCFFAFFGCNFE